MRYVVADVQFDTILKRWLCQSLLPTMVLVLVDNPIDMTLDTKPGKKGLRNLLFWIINGGTSASLQRENGNVKTNSTAVQEVQEGVGNLAHGIHILIFCVPKHT